MACLSQANFSQSDPRDNGRKGQSFPNCHACTCNFKKQFMPDSKITAQILDSAAEDNKDEDNNTWECMFTGKGVA